jgi:organic radical activating enzyme
LEQPDFVGVLAERLAGAGPCVMLETNGVHADALERVMDRIDLFAVDYKLASATGRPAPRGEHRRFLAACRGRDVFVKMVVAASTRIAEVARAAREVAETAGEVPLILQPVSGPRRPGPGLEARLLRLQQAAGRELPDVSVIPQLHVALGIR